MQRDHVINLAGHPDDKRDGRRTHKKTATTQHEHYTISGSNRTQASVKASTRRQLTRCDPYATIVLKTNRWPGANLIEQSAFANKGPVATLLHGSGPGSKLQEQDRASMRYDSAHPRSAWLTEEHNNNILYPG